MGTPLPPVAQPGQGEPVVFFDITLGATNEPLGRIKMHLFAHTLPLTSENFRQFCTGETKSPQTGKPLGYKGCKFHRVVKGFILQSGDFVHTTTPSLLGTGSTSIYNARPFADEGGFMYRHSRAGLLSMANSGPDTNGCQFFITCAPAPHLDGKHVVFGQVVDDDRGESMATVRKIENVRCAGAGGRGIGERPVQDVRIGMSGEL